MHLSLGVRLPRPLLITYWLGNICSTTVTQSFRESQQVANEVIIYLLAYPT